MVCSAAIRRSDVLKGGRKEGVLVGKFRGWWRTSSQVETRLQRISRQLRDDTPYMRGKLKKLGGTALTIFGVDDDDELEPINIRIKQGATLATTGEIALDK